MIELLGALLLQHPFPVGRVAADGALVAGQRQASGVSLAEVDVLGDAGFHGVGPGDLQGVFVDVCGQNPVFPPVFQVLGLGPGLLPDLLGHRGPPLRAEAPAQAGGAVERCQSRFNGNGAAAAEGVPEEVTAPVPGQVHHGGGHGLVEGRFVAHGPIAPLVEAQAGGVQEHLADVFHQGKANLVDCAGLRQPGETVLGAQPVHSGLFHDGLAVWHRVELAIETVALDGELAVPGDHRLQRQGLDALVEFFKGAGFKAAQQQHYPFAHAKAQIGPGHV